MRIPLRTIKIISIVILIAVIGLYSIDGVVAVEASNDITSIDLYKNDPINSKSSFNFENAGKMTVSWYGPDFHGKFTANGEVFDQNCYTAAHKNLPFGTLLKLTNPKNNKAIIVRINDRGPYIKGRQLDLSKAAAIALGAYRKGVIKVNVEKVNFDDTLTPIADL